MGKSGNKPTLGQGVYSLTEVACYTRIPANTIRNWFKGRSDRVGRQRVLQGDYQPVRGDFAVSFMDLIDAYVVGQLRAAGVTMPTVRATYSALEEELESPHPFAHHDIYTDGKRVFTYAAETLEDEQLVDVLTKQQFFPRVRELLSHIQYDDVTRLARLWNIATGVVVNPDLSYGKPVVQGTGVTTFVLSRAYFANDEDAGLVADLYQVSEDDVMNAVRFEEQSGWRKAA